MLAHPSADRIEIHSGRELDQLRNTAKLLNLHGRGCEQNQIMCSFLSTPHAVWSEAQMFAARTGMQEDPLRHQHQTRMEHASDNKQMSDLSASLVSCVKRSRSKRLKHVMYVRNVWKRNCFLQEAEGSSLR